MYKDYTRLTAEGHKKAYIMQYLADEYSISERTIYRVIDRLSVDVSIQ
ncbi:MAG: HTH domain-containing protein [Parabacteroides sp.]|nr:HTH domain-containing protein [Parabacteroides sp.]